MNAKSMLLPAILVAGSPHCGKSVLSFLLTMRLRQMGISHYLLRAAPDWEGDWSALADPALVLGIRQRNKRPFTDRFVQLTLRAIENRLVPLFVDVGGKPRSNQLDLLRACTHYILLYHNETEFHQWQEILGGMNLAPVAELRSDLEGPDLVEQLLPVLKATIGGLDRKAEIRRSGEVIRLLAERLAGICNYDEADFVAADLKLAPFPVVMERDLAGKLGVEWNGQNPFWHPADLARLEEIVPARQPMAIYGRGPIWLAVRLAVLALPSEIALFDPRLGWVPAPRILRRRASQEIKITCTTIASQTIWAEIRLAGTGIMTTEDMISPRPKEEGGIILSGKLPRWYFASMGRALAPHRPWVATYDPRLGQAVIVSSSDPAHPTGSAFPVTPPQ